MYLFMRVKGIFVSLMKNLFKNGESVWDGDICLNVVLKIGLDQFCSERW